LTHGPGYPIRSIVGMALAKSIYVVPTRTRLVALVTEPGACTPPSPLLPGDDACMPDLRRTRTRRALEF